MLHQLSVDEARQGDRDGNFGKSLRTFMYRIASEYDQEAHRLGVPADQLWRILGDALSDLEGGTSAGLVAQRLERYFRSIPAGS